MAERKPADAKTATKKPANANAATQTGDFIWTGPVDSLTLTAEGEGQDVVFKEVLHPGKSYTPPQEHPIIKQLIAAGYFTANDAKTNKGDA